MRSLPRAAWVAGGALAASFALASFEPVTPLQLAALVCLAILGIMATVVLVVARRVSLAALCLGLWSVALRVAIGAVLAGPLVAVAPLPVGSGEWRAVVLDISAPHGSEQRGLLRLAGIPGTASAPDPPDPSWIVYGWLPRHPAVVPGDVVHLLGQVRALPEDNPGFADYLRARGAAGTLRSRAMQVVSREGGLASGIEQLRWSIDASLSVALPEPESGLAAGILVGLRERVTGQVVDDFTITGLTHVVAISGWNIALVAGIVTGLLRATGLRRRARSALVIAAIVAYTLVAGAEASVIRAAVMGGVVMVARESGRPSGAAAALGLACWGLLLADPAMIGDIGLQLSLAATAGLLAMGGPAERAVRRMARGHAPAWLCETLGVSLAAQLATLPLILVHFGRLSLISPLANLVMAPIVPMAMLGAAVAALLGPLMAIPVAAVLSAPLAVAAWLPLAAMVRGAHLLAGVPLASAELPPPLDLAGAAVALLLLAATLRAIARRSVAGDADAPSSGTGSRSDPGGARPGRRRRWTLTAAGLAVLLGAVGGAVVLARPAGVLQVTVLDIGQGDAILLEGDRGSRLLVDGGPDPDLLVRRLDERIPLWDRSIDLVLLTHPHEDHVGGLAGMVPRYRVGAIAETGMASEGAGYTALRGAAVRHGIAVVRLVQGDHFRLDGAAIEVVWPPRGSVPVVAPSSGRAVNDTSIVLAVRIGRQRLLLAGDVEDDVDTALLDALGADGGRWDFLKVAHHGSATATSQPLLDALRPRVAAISVGRDNDYGHPTPQTLERLRRSGAQIWRTDEQGTVSFSFDGSAERAVGASLDPARGSLRLAGAGPPARAMKPCAVPRLARHVGHTAPYLAPSPSTAAGVGYAFLLPCYPRPDAGPYPIRGLGTAHGDIAFSAARPARHRRGRDRRVPRPSAGGWRRVGRPPPRRNSRAPPRRGQGPASRRSAARTGPRTCRRRAPGPGGPPRADARRRRSPGHAACRAGRRGVADDRSAGAAHRGLRGQAGNAAGRVVGSALRPLVPPIPRT